MARLLRLKKFLGALYEGVAEAATAKAKMEAATEAFMLVVVGLEFGEKIRENVRSVDELSSESMRQATVEKEVKKT